jgi:hypothetical protein
MKKLTSVLVFTITASLFTTLSAQDSLPAFSARNAGNNRVVISWLNKYQFVKQISIQRSADSLKNYRTIMTVPDPLNKENGFVDTKAPNDSQFYRLFIVLDGSMFIFSKPQRPEIDTEMVADAQRRKLLDPFSMEINKPAKLIDSSMVNAKDTKNKPNIFVPSLFVYTARDGNVHLNLPDADSLKYSVKFYDERENFLFEIRKLKESSLIIDKTNFYHAGWFIFELFINDTLKEKSKFLLQREF